MANNKVQLSDGTVLLDLTGDTVTPETLLSGVTAHNAAGERIRGAVAPVRYDVAQNLTNAQKEQARENIGAAKSNHDHYGRVIQPTSIELFPATSAGHGGYIDFHFNSDAADYTSRIYEPAKGVLKYNGQGIVSTANIIALYNVHVSFSNGVFEYSNAAIKTTSVCFAQFRGSAVSSGFQDTVLGVTSYAGKLRIIAKNGGTFETDVNILIVNL